MPEYITYNFPMSEPYEVLICGTGGTGSNLVPILAQAVALSGRNNIRILLADGDTFEQKNMKNQKCLPADIGKSKAEVLCSRYKRIYPDLKITYWDQYIKDIYTLYDLFYQWPQVFPILVGCVDNNATRKVFHEFFNNKYVKDLLYIDSGNGTDRREGQIVIGLKKGGNILLPPVCDVYPQILDDTDSIEESVGCTDTVVEHPQNIATNIMAASILFAILNNVMFFNKLNYHLIRFDAENIGTDVVNILRA